jgi:hypothetical protein
MIKIISFILVYKRIILRVMLIFKFNNEHTNSSEKKIQKKTPSMSKKLDIYNTFAKKSDALSYISENPETKLFSEDLNAENGMKRFIVSTYDKIYTLSKAKDKHMYENYEADQPLKLILDIDLKIDSEDKDKQSKEINLFNDLIVRCTEAVNNQLEIYTKIKPITIVLKSCRADKLSAHIIYTNIHFSNISAMKCFMMTVKTPLIDQKIIDPNIYRVGCMRMLWNSKMGKSNILEYDDFDSNDSYEYISDKQLFMDCLITNINTESHLIDFKIPEIVKPMIQKRKNGVKITDNQKYEINVIKQYLDLIDIKRSDDYVEWLKIGMAIYNSNNSLEAFDLWDKWSRNSDKYNGICTNQWKWNSFVNGTLSISTLKYYAKIDNPDAYDKIAINEFISYVPINIITNYLLEQDEKIKDKKSIIGENICQWMDTDIKTLCIRSPYNTGKTTMIKSLLAEFNPKKVLFITHRQSLTNELYGTFKKFKFCSYMNGSYDANRLICQIESLHRIIESSDPFYYEPTDNVKSFDLIILDETESLVNHFMSPTIKNKQETFELMQKLLKVSGKILCLDGDFHNRSYDFINTLGKNIIIHNNIVKDIKRYTFVSEYQKFKDSVDTDLSDNKNVCLVTMSSTQGMWFYNKYKDSYDTMLHSSKSDDQMKDKLQDVERFWKCRLLIYTPSVQSGVSFDTEHFDQMYVILSSKSCSSRDVCQMTHRVRRFKSNDVMVYLNGLIYRENAKFYTYDTMVDYVHNIYKRYKSPSESLYCKMLIYNETENMNKAPEYFVPKYINQIKDKGSTVRYESTTSGKKKKEKINEIDFNINKICEADDINEKTYKQYLQNQSTNKATEAQKYAIEKYIYKKHWGVDITEEFLNLWFRKTYVLDNLKGLTDESMISDKQMFTVDSNNKDNYLLYGKAKQKQRIDMVKELIKYMGFDLQQIGEVVLNRETFVENMNKCVKECKIFTDSKISDILFECKTKELKSVKAFIGYVNSLLKNWGLQVITCEKTIRDIKTKKYISEYTYNLNYYQTINIYI